jgi:predicted nucleotidyltransferase
LITQLPVKIPREQIATFCVRHHIRKLSLFGSVLTERFGPESDVDMLVEFEPGRVPGYFGLSAMERELGELVGRKIDLRTAAELNRDFRDRVVASASVQYERG